LSNKYYKDYHMNIYVNAKNVLLLEH
jgi:hypothetical protein